MYVNVGGQKIGGGTNIADDKIQIREILEDPNNLLITLIEYDIPIDNSTKISIINNIFNKIILLNYGEDIIKNYITDDESIEYELSKTSVSKQDIHNIFFNKYYKPITEYSTDNIPLSYKKMQEIIRKIQNAESVTDEDINYLLNTLKKISKYASS